MVRLGELLVASGLLEPDKLDQALRAQVVWGGRLGTNLIELGFIGLDDLSRVLGKQHNVPAALARHFEKADPELQNRLAPELADLYSFVPLVALPDGKIAVAGMDPLDGDACAVIAAALRIRADQLIVSVAAEQRMRYQLERVYGIARSARYLRAHGESVTPFPQFSDFEGEPDSDADVDIPIEWEEPPAPAPIAQPRVAPTRAETDELATLIDDAIAASPPPVARPAGRERRSYVKTLADQLMPSFIPVDGAPVTGAAAIAAKGAAAVLANANATAPSPAVHKPAPPTAAEGALGRIALRRVAVGPAGAAATSAAPATEPGQESPATLADAARAIRRAPHRERVGDLVIDSLDRFAPACQAAMMFIIRGGTATSWKSLCRSGATPPELAVPLAQAGLVPQAIAGAAMMRGTAKHLTSIDLALMRALGAAESAELVVMPVAIGGKVVCVISIVTEPGASIVPIETIATSAGTAFARLIRDARR